VVKEHLVRERAGLQPAPVRRAGGRSAAAVQCEVGPSAASRCAIDSSGVTPMPPASSRLCVAPSSSGKWLRGGLMRNTAPSCTASCRASEPPREHASRSTPIS
jgi:hypothetical protein